MSPDLDIKKLIKTTNLTIVLALYFPYKIHTWDFNLCGPYKLVNENAVQ